MWFLRPSIFEHARANSCSVSVEAESFADLFGSALGSFGRETDLLCVGIIVMLLRKVIHIKSSRKHGRRFGDATRLIQGT